MKTLTPLAIAATLLGCSANTTSDPPAVPESTAPGPAPSPPGATPGGGSSHAPSPSSTTTTPLDAAANLARLRELSIVEIGALIVTSETANCYYTTEGDVSTNICDRSSKEFLDAKALAEQRLAGFADRVVTAARQPPATTAISASDTEKNVGVLSKLQIVQVYGLVEEQPKNNPNCYNLPCEEDVEAAKAVNLERAGRLANIAKSFE